MEKNGFKHWKNYRNSPSTRKELIQKLSTKEVPLTGGQYTKGTNFELKNFKNSDLKRMLEGSRPLGSSIHRAKVPQNQDVLGKRHHGNINTDHMRDN